MTENPYAAPDAEASLATEESEIEQVRRTHLRAEASIRSIGTLYLAGGILSGLSIIGYTSPLPELESTEQKGALIAMIGIPIVFILLGWKLRKLSRPAAYVAGVISALGLLAFPIGTIINLLFLYVLFSRKGRFVVTPEYRQIIAGTPLIRYRTSIITWVLLGILILLVIFAIIAAVFTA